MKIISCASYYSSGSSAITDFLSEFESIKSLTNYEFRFVQDPDGISELEYNLVENFNRHNSGHALKRYKRLVDYYGNHLFVKRYEPFFDNQWKKLSYDFINALTDFKYFGHWQYDYYDRGALFEFWHKFPERIMHKFVWKDNPDKHLNVLRKEVTYAAHPTEERFLHCTRTYIDMLFNAASKGNYPYIMVDQIVPSSNIKHHIRYFSDIKVFLVDRDPRDVYLLAKYEWNDIIVPKDIDLFCRWFAYARSTKKVELLDNEHVRLIQFEDMIYNYEATIKIIMEWIGISEVEHIEPKKYFNPLMSKKNTRYWIQHPEYKEEADYIKMSLPQYIYEVSE